MTWIAVDESGATLCGWLIAGADAVPIAVTAAGACAQQLSDLIAPHLTPDRVTTVISCGRAGGPFVVVPAPPPDGAMLIPLPCADPRAEAYAVPAFSQMTPADFTQGEETAIAGFLAQHPDYDGVLALPGTHSRWAHISAGEVVSFRSFLTGELFGILAAPSELGQMAPLDDAFADAVSDAMSRPERVMSALFSLRAQTVLHHPEALSAAARLSGMLIGLELAAARPYWLGQQVTLIAPQPYAAPYTTALQLQGITAPVLDRAQMVLAGLRRAYSSLP